MRKYKVEPLMDTTYQVVEYSDCYVDENNRYAYENITVMFQGSLTDCEAWIRLTEGGYL